MIDIVTNGERAIRDNVIVTHTLIVAKGSKTQMIVRDLCDAKQLHGVLCS
ncbi:hypothetical protein [Rhizobium leguminosarum]|nr:hypothetical protein [Rhizobium leguminosarum]